MKNNKHISQEISDYYIKSKQKQMKQIEDGNKKLEELIEVEKFKLEKSREKLEQVSFQNNILQDEYKSLKRVIKERGIIIDINNENYELKEWDSLSFNKTGKNYTLATRKGQILKEYDAETSLLFQELGVEYGGYSALVVRVTPKHVKVQIRLVKDNI